MTRMGQGGGDFVKEALFLSRSGGFFFFFFLMDEMGGWVLQKSTLLSICR